jgi:hypothetical protein
VHDPEQPGFQVGAGLELAPAAQRQHHRVLDKVVCELSVAAAQAAREAAQVGQQRQDGLPRRHGRGLARLGWALIARADI